MVIGGYQWLGVVLDSYGVVTGGYVWFIGGYKCLWGGNEWFRLVFSG